MTYFLITKQRVQMLKELNECKTFKERSQILLKYRIISMESELEVMKLIFNDRNNDMKCNQVHS